MEPFLGQIQAFGFNFAPRGWAKCEGQLLSIAQNSALFSLLGTIYGGDGRTTFALPDLRGRVPMNQGHGPGLSNYAIGQRIGTELNYLNVSQLPPHNHAISINASAKIAIPCVNDDGTSDESENNILANNPSAYSPLSAKDSNLAPFDAQVTASGTSGLTGGSQGIDNIQPTLCINYCIALQGVFPSRS